MCPITASTYNIKEGKQTFIRKGYYDNNKYKP